MNEMPHCNCPLAKALILGAILASCGACGKAGGTSSAKMVAPPKEISFLTPHLSFMDDAMVGKRRMTAYYVDISFEDTYSKLEPVLSSGGWTNHPPTESRSGNKVVVFRGGPKGDYILAYDPLELGVNLTYSSSPAKN